MTSYRGQGTKSQAVFGQGTYELAPGLKILGGVRSTWEQVNQRNIELVCPGDTITLENITPTTCPGIPFVYALTDDTNRPEAKFSNVSWKAGVNYELTPETLAYASVGTGFRGGGLEATGNAPEFREYQPETVTNYEIGVRSSLMGGKLYLAATAFNMDYKDLQVSSIVLNPLTNQVSAVTTNAATARLRGIELEAIVRPTSNGSAGSFPISTRRSGPSRRHRTISIRPAAIITASPVRSVTCLCPPMSCVTCRAMNCPMRPSGARGSAMRISSTWAVQAA